MPKRKLDHDDYIMSKKIRYELTSNKRKYEYDVDFEPNKKVKITQMNEENIQENKENDILKYIIIEMNKEINFLQHQLEHLKNELEIYKNNNFYSKNMNCYIK